MSRNCLRLLLAAVALAASLVHAQPTRPLLGRSVQSVIEELRIAGAPLVYSTSLLPDTLTVTAEPAVKRSVDRKPAIPAVAADRT